MAINNEGQQTFSIINTPMTVSAMRDNGYKSTTHALAELIDNSIEANATHIELFGLSRYDMGAKKRSLRLKELAVLDNGCGMDSDTLRGSLRYGIGTKRNRKGIGRFGLGLPNSSMSQARRVEVWSWQSGANNALYTRLAIDDVESGMEEIPTPKRKAIPAKYRENSLKGTQESGTLVVWSDLDRVDRTRALTIFKNTEYFIGRLYRRFIADPETRLHVDDDRHDEIGSQRYITMIPLQEENGNIKVIEDDIVCVQPNDPLYLMSGSSCPEDFGEGPMFEELGNPIIVSIRYNGREYKVRVRASYSRQHVRNNSHEDARWPEKMKGWDPGSTPWGKHANGNRGVSVVRAHREIDLDKNWINGNDPRERWWTVEIDFPTALDEVFGVTNDKAGVTAFARLAHFDWESVADIGETPADVRRRFEEDEDPDALLWELKYQIDNMITTMRSRIRKGGPKRGPRVSEKDKAAAKVTSIIKRRIEEGLKGISDKKALTGTFLEHLEEQIKSLVRHHYDEKSARLIVERTKDNKVRWIVGSPSTSAFFDVEILPGFVQVVLNENHPVFSHLYNLIDTDIDNLSMDEIKKRLAKATAAFHILIYSWARYEDEQTDKNKRAVRDARLEWGKYAEEFFDEG